MFINERWCIPGYVTVKEHLSSPNVKLLAVSVHPYYLSQEFSSTILTFFVPPSANGAAACNIIHATVDGL